MNPSIPSAGRMGPTRDPQAAKTHKPGASGNSERPPAGTGDSTGDPAAGSDTTQGAAPFAGTGTGEWSATPAADTARVSLAFEVTRQDEDGYSARLVVRNEAADLSSWTIELPIGGQVVSVDGFQWEQHGDTLSITSDEPLTAVDKVTVTLDAHGTAEPPADCTLRDGDCGVSN
ncbi:hypothetical protein [Planotetraspora sp. GP83]|uniref:hypothetical protein n=1 Tax=Planotetraspora sp. GP83 TaxID=3156264 RepID=UPI0035186065